MKRLLLTIGTACIFCTGCASMHRFSDQIIDKAKPLPPYWATTFDAAVIVHAPAAAAKGTDMIFNGPAAAMFGGMALLDLPLALVTDTVCLPYDGYQYLRYDGDVAFWNAFLSGTNDASVRACRQHLTRYTGPMIRKRLPGAKLTESQLTTLLDIRCLHYGLAQCGNLSEAQAMRLWTEAQDSASMDDYCVKRNLALNARVPPNVALRLSEDADRGLVWAVAGNPQLPSRRILELSKSDQSELLQALAGNPSTPEDTLRAMIASATTFTDGHARHMVRRAVAGNPKSSSELLIELSKDPSMVETLIGNPATPPEAFRNILEEGVLNGTKHEAITMVRAMLHPHCPVSAVRAAYSTGKIQSRLFLGVTNAPSDILHAMAVADQRDGKLRDNAEGYLRHPHTDTDTLLLVRDFLSRNLRPNYSTDKELLLRFSQRIDEKERANQAPEDTAHKLADPQR